MSARQITAAALDTTTTAPAVSPQGARMNTNTSLTGARWALRDQARRGGTDPVSRFVEHGEIAPNLVEALYGRLASEQSRPPRQQNHLAMQDIRFAIRKIEQAAA